MAAALECEGRHIIHMGIGEPNFTAAPLVTEAAAMAYGKMQYIFATGFSVLRAEISAHYRQVFGLDIAPERIVVTVGASAALQLACAAPLGNGSEVRMPDSSYPCNRHFIAALDGRAKMIVSVPIECSPLSDGMVHEHRDEHNRGVLLISPSNSTDT
jgi:aspartate/methionine/tyrosine aminotransferase